MSQFMESALLKPLRHSLPSDGQLVQKVHEIKAVDADARPVGKLLGSIMQAERNISKVSATDTSKLERSWFKEVAPSNMLSIFVTEAVLNFERSWLKEMA